MSRNPQHDNRAQRFLYNQGAKDLGERSSITTDVDVRKAGVRRVGRGVLIATGITAGTLGLGAIFGGAMDNSPTSGHMKAVQAEREAQEQEANNPGEINNPGENGIAVTLPEDLSAVNQEGAPEQPPVTQADQPGEYGS